MVNALERRAGELLDDKIDKIKTLLECGHTEDFVMEFFGISRHDWDLIIGNDPSFALALSEWKLRADERVEAALYERAIGYKHPDVHIGMSEGCAVVTPIIKHYPPDVAAATFWLKNRQPAKWRDKVDVRVDGEVEHKHKHLHIVSKVDLEERIEALTMKMLPDEAIDALS